MVSTCVTLADGRVLITSGSEAGGPPTDWSTFSGKGVVRDVEIFDPSTNGLTRSPNIHGDICMYPTYVVWPGAPGFHSRSVSFCSHLEQGHGARRTDSWSAAIPMQGSGTRTYPGMVGARVLLPLLPEEGHAVRAPTGGGGGTRECDLNGNTVCAPDMREILDVDVSGNAGVWAGHESRRCSAEDGTLRFTSDEAPLPRRHGALRQRGSWLAGADDAYASVASAESCSDPQNETFRGMASTSVSRHDHGTALLLPDGSSGGRGAYKGVQQAAGRRESVRGRVCSHRRTFSEGPGRSSQRSRGRRHEDRRRQVRYCLCGSAVLKIVRVAC